MLELDQPVLNVTSQPETRTVIINSLFKCLLPLLKEELVSQDSSKNQQTSPEFTLKEYSIALCISVMFNSIVSMEPTDAQTTTCSQLIETPPITLPDTI